MLPSHQELINAFGQSDPAYDGIFYVAVRTTGIVCRPSCKPPRKPLLKNVEFYATIEEALHQGYRPCKLCRPDEHSAKKPDWVERLIARSLAAPEQSISDDELRQMGIEPTRLRRFFVKHYGTTFRRWQRQLQMSAALGNLRKGNSVTDVTIEQGYESPSGFGSAFRKTFGHSPKQGKNMDCIVTTWIHTPIGDIQLGASSKGLCFLEFDDPTRLASQLNALEKSIGMNAVAGMNQHLEQAKEELSAYFAGSLQNFSLTLHYQGSSFQQQVWGELQRIPYGETRSYEDIARAIGNPKAVRAVGTTNGLNRIAIIIPCHRVVNKGGTLGGYGGGLWRKRLLLALEQGKQIEQQQSNSIDNNSHHSLPLFAEEAHR